MTEVAPSTSLGSREQPSTDASARGGGAPASPIVAALDGPTLDGLARTRAREAEVPRRVGRYTVLRHLGKGGMGQVLEALDPELDRRVALKLLRVGRGGTAANARLLREAQVMARISDPHVVQVYDAGLAGDRVFLAMELVRGRTLRQWLAAGPRPWREILRVMIDAGRGLAAAHAVGVIHRDFKPDNVLVDDDGRVRVADFGLANLERAAVAAARPGNFEGRFVGLTQTGAIVGTPLYMAPEQHAGLELDARADQFSFCVALHEALLGAHPYPGTTAIELAAAVLAGRYVAPPSRRGLPRALVRAIERGLATDPGRRFVDIEAL
ncbi:MAG: serine/threonine protein kinase, partial [Nannocystaceae bacterium]|nr:serine/threonine protein kinase [Nannocystaceae bacterium]